MAQNAIGKKSKIDKNEQKILDIQRAYKMSIENINDMNAKDRYRSQKKNESRIKNDNSSHKNLIINNIENNKYQIKHSNKEI